MAFVSSFVPGVLSTSSVLGSKVCSATTNVAARVSMQEKSPAMPFMDKPSNLSPDMPGYVGFDPLQISSYMNVQFLQEAEIKHGRICMLAFLGLVVAEVYQFPFYQGAPHLVIRGHDWGVTNGALAQILLWCSFFEAMTTPAVTQMINGKSDRTPGDFCFDPLGLGKDPAKMAKFRVNEVKNGRLAMVAVSGAIHHAALSNQNLLEQLSSGNILPKF